jgi:predicted CoA-binding protein
MPYLGAQAMSPSPQVLEKMLDTCHTIAVVGLSKDPARASYQVARYLQEQGFRIVPVNPGYAGDPEGILGEACYASLLEIPFPVDLVDVFRKTEEVLPIAEQAVAIGAKCLWQQLGIHNEAAQALAQAAGLWSVSDACLKVEHAKLKAKASKPLPKQ